MSNTRRRKTLFGLLALAAALVVLFAALCIVEVLRYPRIARSAYLRHPGLLAQATWSRILPGQGIPSRDVLAHARQVYPASQLSIFLLHLPDEPKNDKSIRDRVFGLIGKQQVQTREQSFWVVSKSGGTLDDWLVYEYRTGKLVCQPD